MAGVLSMTCAFEPGVVNVLGRKAARSRIAAVIVRVPLTITSPLEDVGAAGSRGLRDIDPLDPAWEDIKSPKGSVPQRLGNLASGKKLKRFAQNHNCGSVTPVGIRAISDQQG